VDTDIGQGVEGGQSPVRANRKRGKVGALYKATSGRTEGGYDNGKGKAATVLN
jgi:hypothetical protein